MRHMRLAVLFLSAFVFGAFPTAAQTAAAADAQGASEGSAGLTYVVAGTPLQLYGHLDLSTDAASKGTGGRTIVPGDVSNPIGSAGTYTAAGSMGFLPDISSNLSYFGIRGHYPLSDDLKLVFQIETQVDVAATPGTSDNGSSADNAVKGAFASRNSFLGMENSWGTVAIGKYDTPYKSSTAKLDPFSATVGDYNGIMGNTGGDNRAEFDPRASHAIWYDSPNLSGLQFHLMYSPGQNRTDDNSDIAAAEPSCSGQDNPLNGGQICGDGSYGNVWSASFSFSDDGFYSAIAGELHENVNRSGDETEGGGGAPPGQVGVGDEWAAKAGIQYVISPTRTTVDAIFEDLGRNAPNPNYNERTRIGWWFATSQKLNDSDQVNVGWGHAGNTPGDPGDPLIVGTNGATSAGPKANAANLLALGYQHFYRDHRTTFYAVYATEINQEGAHYDLGASGHGVTTDCHDGTLPAGGFSGGGAICFTGSMLQAASIGMTHDF